MGVDENLKTNPSLTVLKPDAGVQIRAIQTKAAAHVRLLIIMCSRLTGAILRHLEIIIVMYMEVAEAVHLLTESQEDALMRYIWTI